jgi:hypothetical protein
MGSGGQVVAVAQAVTPGGQVDDAPAAAAQPQAPLPEEAVSVGTPVLQDRGQVPEEIISHRFMIQVQNAADAVHISKSGRALISGTFPPDHCLAGITSFHTLKKIGKESKKHYQAGYGRAGQRFKDNPPVPLGRGEPGGGFSMTDAGKSFIMPVSGGRIAGARLNL